MLLISKYKDYYDFLSGIYGVDPLIVLDRREFTMPDIEPTVMHRYNNHIQECKLTLYIGGYCIQCYCLDGVCYYGDDLNQFKSEKKHSNYYNRLFKDKDKDKEYDFVNIKSRNYNRYINIKNIIYKDTTKLNDKHDCPILVRKDDDRELYRYCKLKDLNLNSFVSPEDVYRLISDWLSNQRTNAENKENNMTNIEKLESKGFDKKTSFRPNIKD